VKVGRGGGAKPPEKPAPKQPTAIVDEVAPRLRVGVPGKSYTPKESPRQPAPRPSLNDDGWFDAVAAGGPDGATLGLTRQNQTWACTYGCPGTMSKVDGVAYHHYQCPYWEREGKNEHPF
jgi:hypothetical protein